MVYHNPAAMDAQSTEQQIKALTAEVLRLNAVIRAMQQNPQVFVQAQSSRPNYMEMSANALSLILKHLNDKALARPESQIEDAHVDDETDDEDALAPPQIQPDN